jgi:site-specific recombinase XerD
LITKGKIRKNRLIPLKEYASEALAKYCIYSFYNSLQSINIIEISYRTQDHLPRTVTIHSGLGPPRSSLI